MTVGRHRKRLSHRKLAECVARLREQAKRMWAAGDSRRAKSYERLIAMTERKVKGSSLILPPPPDEPYEMPHIPPLRAPKHEMETIRPGRRVY